MATVQIDSLTKAYGAATVINDLSLEVQDGEFLILVGPSGCGKSTLLRMIAGLDSISEGTVSIGSRVVNDVRPKDRNIAMVFQSYALYPHKTVAQNMGFALHLSRVAKPEIENRVRKAAEILDLTHLMDRYPKNLSGGQRQRVAMGRAIVRDPEVFLFDEPLSNLDAKLRVQMRSEIKALHQRLKTTTIYVTHDQVEAMTMADRIVVMNRGQIEQIGTPLELYDRPRNIFVATFIGSPSMNLLKGAISGTSFRTDDGREFALDPERAAKAASRPLIAGIRPEHVEILAPGTPGGMEARVVVQEPTGVETLISVKLGKTDLHISLRDRMVIKPDQLLQVRFHDHRVELFDAESQLRIPHRSEEGGS